jgi:tripartite-type tricarboxylate transporter receptor subunit TctC
MMLLLKQRGARPYKAPLPRLTAMSRASLLGLLATATLLSLASFTQAAQAQTRPASDPQAAISQYPSRTIKMLVGFPPGGPNDQLARLLGLRLADQLKQSIVIENKAGANGEIAATQTAAATPDGYTLLFGSSGALAVSPSLNPNLPYDPLKDLTPISMVALNPMLLVTSPKSGITSVADLIARAKAQPGKLTFASAGTGSPTHLAGELFRDIADINLLHVPYKGGGPAMNDVMSGEIDMYFAGLSTALPLVNAGRLHAHALTTSKRSDTVPKLPTISELGFSSYSAIIWYGVLAPAGLPEPLVTLLRKHLVAIMNMPDFRKQLSDLGAEVYDQSPAEFRAFMKEDLDKWAKVIAAMKLTK